MDISLVDLEALLVHLPSLITALLNTPVLLKDSNGHY
jgi:hypothetical protein